jgi:hypothetical protein
VNFSLEFQPEAKAALLEIERDNQKKYRKVLKTLGLMQTNLRHPGLNTHKYNEYKGLKGEDIFESYVENRTPGAFRVFWYYGPQKGVITVVAITPYP